MTVREEIGAATPGQPPQVVAVIPAYNEERFIGSVVLKARQHVDRVIVVDDGSTDATGAIAAAAGAIVLRHEPNQGKGAALNTGFHHARDLGARAVVLLDGDGQHRPEDIPRLVQPVLDGQADMVIGSRYLGLESEIPAYRRLGQRVVTTMTNTCSGVRCTDSWSGYRAFSRRALQCIFFGENGWGVDPEFQFQAREHHLEVVEVPIVAIYEEQAKRNPFAHGFKTVNAILRMVSQHRPLLYFGVTGLLILGAGLLTGLWVVERFITARVLPTGIALISVLLTIIGMLSLFTGIILHSIRGLMLSFVRTNGHGD